MRRNPLVPFLAALFASTGAAAVDGPTPQDRAAFVQETVQAHGVKRLLVDGLVGFKEATVHPERVNRFFAVLTNQLRSLGVTAVFTEETRLLFGPEVEAPVKSMSALVAGKARGPQTR